MITREIIVSGRVQGVYYRVSAMEKAEALGLTGRVKNLRDGRVWMVATGSEEAMEKFIRWNHSGPAGARVEEVEIKETRDPGFSDFRIERVN